MAKESARVVWGDTYMRLVRVVNREGSRWVKRFIVERRAVDAMGTASWSKVFEVSGGYRRRDELDACHEQLCRRMLLDLADPGTPRRRMRK